MENKQTFQKLETINFHGVKINTSGDSDNPLFSSKEICIDLLGYKSVSDCRFYKDNKHNIECVIW